ncbi:MAG TPA: ABC transporter ATP-binding protein, partial [Pseudolabrys sp.]|nr:ABC transporter ATP-binding protein [Pseudolabrys sp.]
YLIGHAVNEAYVSKNIASVALVCVAIILIAAVKGLTTYFQTIALARISSRITANNQRRLCEKVLHQGLGFFANRHSSEFSARITWGARAVSDTLNTLITTLGRDAMSLISLVGVMVYQSPVLSLIALVVMPPAVLATRAAMKRVRLIVRNEFGAATDILETLQETVQGFKVVEAFNLHQIMRDRVNSNVMKIEQVSNKLARAMNFSNPLMESLGGIAIALVMLLGGYQTIVLDKAPGEYFSFIAAFLLAYEPAKRLTRLNIELSNSLTGVRILFEFLDLPDRPDDNARPAIKVDRGRVEFRGVEFSYRPAAPVLRGVSFTAEPGRVTALVGPSGGGKSTILNLLLRLYDVYDGSILIDGTEISSVSRKLLRDHLAFVGQDAFLFRGTIRENIALGHPGASEPDIVAAAKAAHAHEFICRFASGYDTQVGEHGMQLSGGQRQRISVARALIRKASIILLDEPTSFLDSETERYVNLAISNLFSGQTRLVIAHRLNTIINADNIYVLEEGRVVESGRHEFLLGHGVRYARFFNLQFNTDGNMQVN